MKRVIKDSDFLNFKLVVYKDEFMSHLPEEIKYHIQSYLFSLQCSKGCKMFLSRSKEDGFPCGCKCTIKIYNFDTESFDEIELEKAINEFYI